jgi:hypothetical protein
LAWLQLPKCEPIQKEFPSTAFSISYLN